MSITTCALSFHVSCLILRTPYDKGNTYYSDFTDVESEVDPRMWPAFLKTHRGNQGDWKLTQSCSCVFNNATFSLISPVREVLSYFSK